MSYTRFRRVLLAIDETPCSEKVIELAKQYISFETTSLALVTVITPTSPTSYGVDPLLGQQPIVVAEIAEIQQQAADDYLNRISSQFADANELFNFTRIGNVKEEILDTATEWAADLIIIGTNGRTGFDHFISGSVSESVVRHATCPVLVIPNKC